MPHEQDGVLGWIDAQQCELQVAGYPRVEDTRRDGGPTRVQLDLQLDAAAAKRRRFDDLGSVGGGELRRGEGADT